eukprot:gene3181-1705_t
MAGALAGTSDCAGGECVFSEDGEVMRTPAHANISLW